MKKTTAVILSLLAVFMMIVPAAAVYNGTTSFEYRYPDAFGNAKKEYPAFSAALTEALSGTPVPGNIISEAYSEEAGLTTTDNMVPQGLCVTDDYILTTAYDNTKEYNSLIYVMSSDGSALLAVIAMPDKNHSGGIATDGKNIYIAKDKQGVAYFPCDIIETAAAAKGVYILESYTDISETIDTASLITYHDGKMWVGKFNEKEDSYLYDYTINEDGSLTRGSITYTLPKKLQGVSFFEARGKTWMLAACSYGRTNTSTVYIYEINNNEPTKTFEYVFPPMAEEVDVHDGTVYIIFESSATEYSTKESRCPTPVDRISALDTDKLTDKGATNKTADFFARIRMFFLKIFDFIASLFRK